jgi:hypothetical protein
LKNVPQIKLFGMFIKKFKNVPAVKLLIRPHMLIIRQ